MCICLLVRGCCVSLRGAWLSFYELYNSPKSTSTARMPPWPNGYGSAPRWWCTLKNWLPAPWDVVCTERTPAPSIIGNHTAWVLGTTITTLASHFTYVRQPYPRQGRLWETVGTQACSPRHVAHVRTEHVYPGCIVCMKRE